MKDNNFFPLVHQRQFTEIDFLSYIGGTLGLFAGFSILTFLELFFYFIFRPSVRWVREKCRSKVSSIENMQDKTESRKNNKKLKKTALTTIRYFFSYMEECTLHGLNHATFKNLIAIERCFWLVAFVASMVICGLLLSEMREKYVNAPVTISFDGDMKSVKDVRIYVFYFLL